MAGTEAIPRPRDSIDTLRVQYDQGEIGDTDFFTQLMLDALHETGRRFGRDKRAKELDILSKIGSPDDPDTFYSTTVHDPIELPADIIGELVEGRNPILKTFQRTGTQSVFEMGELLLQHGAPEPVGEAYRHQATSFLIRQSLDSTAGEVGQETPIAILQDFLLGQRTRRKDVTPARIQEKIDSRITAHLWDAHGRPGYWSVMRHLPWAHERMEEALSRIFDIAQESWIPASLSAAVEIGDANYSNPGLKNNVCKGIAQGLEALDVSIVRDTVEPNLNLLTPRTQHALGLVA